MDATAEILNRLSAIESMLRSQVKREPGLSVTAFAKRVNRSRSTIYRMLEGGELYKKRGRIPAELLGQFLS